ncbi:MAG: hypothetical protein J07HX5_00988 [halophilic archaeon J07HX5]|jgi:hypothetical protein|nr:MAG: hypothetical protein J07HX5_00988 [halophilic archaeon J07HX5]
MDSNDVPLKRRDAIKAIAGAGMAGAGLATTTPAAATKQSVETSSNAKPGTDELVVNYFEYYSHDDSSELVKEADFTIETSEWGAYDPDNVDGCPGPGDCWTYSGTVYDPDDAGWNETSSHRYERLSDEFYRTIDHNGAVTWYSWDQYSCNTISSPSYYNSSYELEVSGVGDYLVLTGLQNAYHRYSSNYLRAYKVDVDGIGGITIPWIGTGVGKSVKIGGVREDQPVEEDTASITKQHKECDQDQDSGWSWGEIEYDSAGLVGKVEDGTDTWEIGVGCFPGDIILGGDIELTISEWSGESNFDTA